MTAMLSSPSPDVIHLEPRQALPFRVENGPAGPELVWEETVQHRYTGAPLRLPVRFGSNNVISWQRLQEPLLALMRQYREMEQRALYHAAENERLKIELAQAEGRLRDLEKSDKFRRAQKNNVSKDQG